MTKSYETVKTVEELTPLEIKKVIALTITNNINIIDNLKEVLEFFECNGVEDLSDYENEQRENIYSSLEDLGSEIHFLSQMVDFYEIWIDWILPKSNTLPPKIGQYIKDYKDGKYEISDRKVA